MLAFRMYEDNVDLTPEEIYEKTFQFYLVLVIMLFVLYLLMLLKRRSRIKEDIAFERGQAEIVKKTADMI